MASLAKLLISKGFEDMNFIGGRKSKFYSRLDDNLNTMFLGVVRWHGAQLSIRMYLLQSVI
jgi:hypothetical protein